MKTKLLISALLLAGTLLSSCSKLSNISVTKRHYRSGFYVDLGSSRRSESRPRVSKAETAVTSPSASGNVKEKGCIAPEKTVQAPTPVFHTRYAEEKKQADKKASNTFASAQDISTTDMDLQAAMSYVASLPDAITPVTAESSESAPMWVIILFAILIPPIGVALKFGIIDKFWISLLLTLIFWLPGAIYSLIVVTEK